ncbi:GrpB family protein [Thermoactinomyces daqus]|uniref:GrpB family protein n=1 Tax=Thermoactinomyces daqus TaxID=1329516 RepID=A0A7W1X877_9BACL|nr:GrpB family protein [Thermoactinomyces daqus]MBA4541866.1 GrpB family protein [Thermoactinomyces daqus]
MRKVIVTPYNPRWPEQFAAEAKKIKEALGPEAVCIHHIGSTAVPGLAAKPIIDLIPVVNDIEKIDKLTGNMKAIGYVPMGEYGIPGRRYFFKGSEQVHTHRVHIFARGNPEITRHLAFRDYLRAHPDEARRYAELKINLAKQYPASIEHYISGKNDLIKELEQKAMRWWETGKR